MSVRRRCGGRGSPAGMVHLVRPAVDRGHALPLGRFDGGPQEEAPNDPGLWSRYAPVLCGMFPKAVKPQSSSPLRSPGSVRKDLTYSA